MKAGVVVGFLFFVVASVLLYRPTKTDSRGKVTRGESLIEKIDSNRVEELEKSAPMFRDKTPKKKAEEEEKLKKSNKEFARVKKFSKPIPLKLVSGKIPLTATYSTTSNSDSDNEAIYDMGIQHRITSYSFSLTCSGPILTTCHWYLSISKNKKEWESIANGDSQSNISHSGDSAVVSGNIIPTSTSRYVKWRVVAKGAMMPGVYQLTISNPEIKGINSKQEVK